jgi:gliding motility-associated-like protein
MLPCNEITKSFSSLLKCIFAWFESLDPVTLQDTVQCDKIYIPNTFVTEHDGISDEFKPVFACPPVHYEMWVYDRWGYLIYYTTDPAKGWDGTIKRETEEPIAAQPGDYIYKIKCSLFYGDSKRTCTGQVSLLR